MGLFLHFAKSSKCDILGAGDPEVLGAWPWNSNLAEIFSQCTYPLSFVILCLIVRKLSRWETNKQTYKQVDAAENIHLASLCYAGEKSNSISGDDCYYAR